MSFPLIVLAGALSAQAVAAEAVSDPNYTTQNLLVYNNKGQVLLQRNFMGWSTPGLRYDKRQTIRESLDGLATNYGVSVGNVRLAGMFSYRYGYTPAISTRTHYAAKLAGGTPKAPAGFDEVRWFSPPAALAAVGSASQKSPPALVQLTRQMLTRPETIWGGSFYVWEEDKAYKSRPTEPFHALGKR
ncbi:MAG TPA: NUDIX hydrolase [Sphingomonadaceae bacterium]|nr:NUDIX hydrolase [Sphingomonadaceae bacterium]